MLRLGGGPPRCSRMVLLGVPRKPHLFLLCACMLCGEPPTRASSTVAMALSGNEASVSAVNSSSVHSAIMALADTAQRSRGSQARHISGSSGSGRLRQAEAQGAVMRELARVRYQTEASSKQHEPGRV